MPGSHSTSAGPRNLAATLFSPETCASRVAWKRCPRLHSNEDPGPGFVSPAGRADPSPLGLSRPRGSAWCRLQRLLSPLPVRCPAFRPRPALTFLRPLLSFTCDFAETRHQTRASTRGVGLPSPHAQGGMSSETSRPSSQSKPVPGAHASRFIYCVSFSPQQAFPPREEWDRKFQQGTEVSGWKGEISNYIWAVEWVNWIFEIGVEANPPLATARHFGKTPESSGREEKQLDEGTTMAGCQREAACLQRDSLRHNF
ncbi:uncharacterized protein [Symphalangus syndactylus]|uniref:uncharacterized protein isoform X1 n=2 Tax=Symphalangus syndactylus TaxID=9590 RepID=UPI0030048619